jgi:hypothetical protein
MLIEKMTRRSNSSSIDKIKSYKNETENKNLEKENDNIVVDKEDDDVYSMKTINIDFNDIKVFHKIKSCRRDSYLSKSLRINT